MRRRSTWLLGWPILLAVACAAPVPSGSPSVAPTSAPPTTTAPTDAPATASATAATELTHFSGGDNEFDYPSDWRVIAESDIRIGQITYVVVGTGDWRSGCSGFDNCTGEDVFVADPGELVAHFSSFYSGPAHRTFETPPSDALQLPSGLAATVEDGPQRTLATIYIPGRRAMTVDVRYGGAPSDADRAAVHRMIDSTAAGGQAPANIRTATSSITSADCVDRTFRGQLARGDLGGLNIAPPGFSWATVLWPHGWTARLGDDNRVELFDGQGAFVAREWDEVEIGGRGDSNDFQACDGAVSVIQPFPLSPE